MFLFYVALTFKKGDTIQGGHHLRKYGKFIYPRWRVDLKYIGNWLQFFHLIKKWIRSYLIRAAINPYRCVLIRGLSNCFGMKSWIWKHHGWVWPREIGQSYNTLSHFDSFPPYFQTLQKQKRACFDEKILHDYGEPWVEKMTFCRMHRQTGFPFWNPFFDEFTLKVFD